MLEPAAKEACLTCEGSGQLACGDCNGGTTECITCGGNGCPDCKGNGYRSCDYCGGAGVLACWDCNSNGEHDITVKQTGET